MDVIGIGLANIDLVARVDEAFLRDHDIPKGREVAMNDLSFGRMRAAIENFEALPGGCAANTLCGLSALGIQTRFFGKIGADAFESLYRTAFHDYMVEYDVAPAATESSQCIVLITPDGERSFAYGQGASWQLNSNDIDWSVIEDSQLVYAEIYTCAFGSNTDLFEQLCDAVRKNNIPLYIKIVDRVYGERYKDLIREQAKKGAVHLVIGNQDNLPILTGGFTPTLVRESLKEWPCPVLMTAAARGGTYFENGQARDFTVEAVSVPKNSSGAGDQFMAGFIAGRLDHKSVDECIALGARLAREILMHPQPRPPLATRQSIRF